MNNEQQGTSVTRVGKYTTTTELEDKYGAFIEVSHSNKSSSYVSVSCIGAYSDRESVELTDKNQVRALIAALQNAERAMSDA